VRDAPLSAETRHRDRARSSALVALPRKKETGISLAVESSVRGLLLTAAIVTVLSGAPFFACEAPPNKSVADGSGEGGPICYSGVTNPYCDAAAPDTAPLWPTCGLPGVLHPTPDTATFLATLVGTWRRCGDPLDVSSPESAVRINSDSTYEILGGADASQVLRRGTITLFPTPNENVVEVDFNLPGGGAFALARGVLADAPRSWHATNTSFDYRFVDWSETQPARQPPSPPDGGWPEAGSASACHVTPGAARSFAADAAVENALIGNWRSCSSGFSSEPWVVGVSLAADGGFGLVVTDEQGHLSVATDIDHAGAWSVVRQAGQPPYTLVLRAAARFALVMPQMTVTDPPVALSGLKDDTSKLVFVPLDLDAGL